MRQLLRQKVIGICDVRIARRGDGAGLSFYASFANRNDDPELLMEATTWWIRTYKLDHFCKAAKMRQMLLDHA
ncbi:hypothetical protein SAMN05877838_2851 [Hoeflea halophila]|uniref:Uncharacterized protein n=1 Tax=Hoeflea halophila TaxID=714899 RepID=A0A286ICS5_9HYPH|nr:DUF6500 family protein [Hoeflea halophila]SOE17943.1 hypothetical protein SAMN05877838_2851 [Hoeflea halophila]